MRFSRCSRSTLPGGLLVVVLVVAAGSASAQDEMQIRGIASARFAHAYEMSNLDIGGDLDDSRGMDIAAGFRLGDYFGVSLGYEWQADKDFDTHYFPVEFRGYSPLLLERVSFFGTVGIGLFFTRPSNEFNANDEERASAFHAGGGLQIDISENLGLLWYAKYKRGLGQVEDYESVVHGVGLQYSWGL